MKCCDIIQNVILEHQSSLVAEVMEENAGNFRIGDDIEQCFERQHAKNIKLNHCGQHCE